MYSKEIDNILKNFFRKLKCNFKHCDLKYFYQNIKTLKIKDEFFCGILPETSSYMIDQNKIELISIDDLNHELLHMASSYYIKDKANVSLYNLFKAALIAYNTDEKDDIVNPEFSHNSSGRFYSGFSVGLFGNGINEGYTELLCRRYFSKHHDSYPIERQIALNIERIVGKTKMEQMYFLADADGLINELAKYIQKEKVIENFKVIDLIAEQVDHIDRKKNQLAVINNLKKINLFLLECYVNKLIIQLENRKITKQNFYVELRKYIKGLKYVCNDERIKCYILSDDVIINEFEKIDAKVLHL